MAKQTGPERVQHMLDVLHTWQKIERLSMGDTAKLVADTKSPLIRIIMEIIGHDSQMHHRVQQFLIDSLTVQSVAVTREDLAEIWKQIEAHDQMERKTIQLAEDLRDKAWSPTHEVLLDYLLTDERKHDTLLDNLRGMQRGMSMSPGA